MAYELIDAQKILNEAKGPRKPYRIQRAVSLSITSKNGSQVFTLSRSLTKVIGPETIHIAVEFDPDTLTMAIRPSACGEPSFKLYRAGGLKGDLNDNRRFPAASLRKHLGIPDGVSGKFKAKVKDGRILVDLKSAFKKSARAKLAA